MDTALTNLKPTLLIAEDEEGLREMYAEEAKDLGLEVILAVDGQEALELLQKSNQDNPIDAILSDINMPRLNGLELLARIRELGYMTQFAFISAYGDAEKVEAAQRLGAAEFLDKPCPSETLRKALTKITKTGVNLRTLEHDLEVLCKKSGLEGADLEEFRKSQRAILQMKRSHV